MNSAAATRCQSERVAAPNPHRQRRIRDHVEEANAILLRDVGALQAELATGEL